MSEETNTGGGAASDESANVVSVWQDYIQPFAERVGKSVDEVTEALSSLVGDAGDEAIELLRSEEYTPFDEIRAKFDGVPTARLKKAVADHLRFKEEVPSVAATEVAQLSASTFELLPSVPEDDAWLRMLKTGGELKVDTTRVISALRAALASRSGLYDLPNQLAERMESHAESLDEPVGEEFFKLRRLLTQRSYAEIFSALKVDGQFVSQKRKNGFLVRLDQVLWPALLSFQEQLKSWSESWQAGMSNPAAMMGAFAVMAGGGTGAGAAMPPSMMQPPATDGLRDAAESVNNEVNKVFAGVGVPIAMALAYDAQRIKEVLSNSTLPSQVGAANRDQMLKMLGVEVSADYVRLERNITRFTLGIMEYPNMSAGQEELGYLTSLLMLGSQIPWDKLEGSLPSSRSRTGSRKGRDLD